MTPANTAAANDYAYYAGSGDYLRYLKFGLNASGTPVLSDAANSAGKFGFSSGSPVVTSNGADPASALVWVVTRDGHLLGFGSPDASPVTGAAPTDFGQSAVGTGVTQNVVLTATSAVTLSDPT